MSALTIYDLEQTAVEELQEILADETQATLADSNNQTASGSYISDIISEIADSNIPIYTRDIFLLASSCISLALHIPDEGYDPKRGAVGLIQANIYEHLTNRLYTELHNLAEQVTV